MTVKDIKQKATLAHERYHVRKFFKSLEHRGAIVNGKAVLLVYNDKEPELSYVLTDSL